MKDIQIGKLYRMTNKTTVGHRDTDLPAPASGYQTNYMLIPYGTVVTMVDYIWMYETFGDNSFVDRYDVLVVIDGHPLKLMVVTNQNVFERIVESP